MSTPPDVIGIDPSLKNTGICLANGQCFHLSTGGAELGDARLHDLRRRLRYYLRRGSARLAVVEDPTGSKFRSGDAAIAAGMVQGIVREILVEFRIPFGKVNATKLKQFATGKGNADKAEMIAAANRHRQADPRRPVDGTYDDLTDDNEADAWWLRQMGLWHLGWKHLDPAQDTILNSATVRDAVIRPSKGTKWPGR